MELQNYFKQAIDRRASDLHLVVGNKPALRIDGELVFVEETALAESFMESSLLALLDNNRLKVFNANRELDFSTEVLGNRFRINLHFQSGKIGLAARLIKNAIPSAQELGFSDAMINLTRLKDGLVLVTGPSGSGKSTTLATIIDIINQARQAHIITIEDPIEYIFTDKKSIVEQREVGSDTLSFEGALKHVLRQDPNVIMIGEMRDTETIAAALMAAETGHLVLSTLHTVSAAETVARVVDSFPAHRKQQVLVQLSLTLRAVIAQQLIPRVGGGLVAAREIMINNPAVSNLILENKVNQLPSIIKTNYQLGMIDMNRSVELLCSNGLVDNAVAEGYKRNLETRGLYYNDK